MMLISVCHYRFMTLMYNVYYYLYIEYKHSMVKIEMNWIKLVYTCMFSTLPMDTYLFSSRLVQVLTIVSRLNHLKVLLLDINGQ